MVDAAGYFPEGLAKGEAFINRDDERKFLIGRIKAVKHTVLIAPRRYGKTSLVVKVSEELKLPYCMIDFLTAYNEEYVRDQIVSKVSRLVLELLPKMNKAKEKLLGIFKKMKPEIAIGAFGQKLSLSFSNQPLQDITDLLLKLDETAKAFNKKVVVFMDEFQQVSQLNQYNAIEASIRHAVERSENIAYVFSGSNRNLLKQMFGDHGRPLYRLCQIINIERMHKKAYQEHLQMLAKMKWKKILSEEILEKIFNYTELHPFYMNVLCQLLWDKKTIFSTEDVDAVWQNYVKTQRHVISHDIGSLSANQRKIMLAIAQAQSPVKEIQASQFTTPLKISASSAQQALKVLVSNDLVYKNENGEYAVLDPAMRYYLAVIIGEDV